MIRQMICHFSTSSPPGPKASPAHNAHTCQSWLNELCRYFQSSSGVREEPSEVFDECWQGEELSRDLLFGTEDKIKRNRQ